MLALKDYATAGEAIKSAQTHNPSSPQAHFLAFQLALLTDKKDEGERIVALKTIDRQDKPEILNVISEMATGCT